ncbi:phosphoenolpyruvate carboxykinase (ATP) [Bacillus timonensis]|uniref:aldolase n=1 Tax=Bacillus timonensis TaxID=1033734 RepID=UPI000287CA96|nr:aldolase [Bacillus timonensis]
MTHIITNKIYKAYGFYLKSEISLPELPQVCSNVIHDIEIITEDVTDLWVQLSDTYNAFVIKENLVMFQVPNIAIFAISNGNQILITPLEGYDEDVVRLYILGICMGSVLLQRKIVPLHGSAVEINGKAYAFVGNSGAGKSTLASTFVKQGFKLLSDDVIAVIFKDDNPIPYVTPSYPQQKLWEESLNKLDMEAKDYRSIYGRETKYSVPVSNYSSENLPLAGVFEIMKTDNDDIKISEIEKLESFYTLYYHTFQNCLIQGLGLMDWHFKTTTKIIENIKMNRVQRPVSSYTAPQLVSLILSNIMELAPMVNK